MLSHVSTLQPATLIRRYKRFLADVETPSGAFTVHCPNTGTMRSCGEPGSTIYLSQSTAKTRKYPHTWELSVSPDGGYININSRRANEVMAGALFRGLLPNLAGYTVSAETSPHPGCRFDFLLKRKSEHCWLEVKSVTLRENDGCLYFPDARSQRALKHVQTLVSRVTLGERGILVFLLGRNDAKRFSLAEHIYPEYAAAVLEAQTQGVEIYVYNSNISLQGMSLGAEWYFDGKHTWLKT